MVPVAFGAEGTGTVNEPASSSDDAAEPEYLDAWAAAARAGITRKSLYSYLSRGDCPEPDLVFLGRILWLPETIDEWRSRRYERRTTPRIPRSRKFDRTPTRRLPPKVVTTVKPGARTMPGVGPVAPVLAKAVAAAIREQGHYCTTEDVLELAALEDDAGLEHERALLRRRIVSKLRGLLSRKEQGGRPWPPPAPPAAGDQP